MIADAQEVLNKFEQLSILEKKKVASAILRESLEIEPEFTNDKIISEDFSKHKVDKIGRFLELIKEYSAFIEIDEQSSSYWLLRLEQEISDHEKSLKRFWEFYHKLNLISQKEITQEFQNSQQRLVAGFDKWLTERKRSDDFHAWLSDQTDVQGKTEANYERDLWLEIYTFTKDLFEETLGSIKADSHWQIAGSRVSKYSVISAFEDGASAEEIALRFPTLNLKQIYSEINSYIQNPAEYKQFFDEQIRHQDELADHIEDRFSPKGLKQKLLKRSQIKK